MDRTIRTLGPTAAQIDFLLNSGRTMVANRRLILLKGIPTVFIWASPFLDYTKPS
ncbi:hypothetical protein HanXRQr2_Chr01g0008481 [Helianthus annuus]|uniref:Uncharacterized protein n=1 Tax=Helianthus annuus TaxID=4232 RepID=A0A9K3P1A9_HELAN|nr:hypothetical protein HanXRQr2_Chr01g0008481 [Helianthus annuus]KAJ0610726.1 hypothetical protein HanHA300_Chr01g0006991 [Helianthus annuus]